MVYLVKKQIKDKNYFYLVKNIRISKTKWKKISKYISNKKDILDIKKIYFENEKYFLKKELDIKNNLIYRNNFEIKLPIDIELKSVEVINKISILSKKEKDLIYEKFSVEFIVNSNKIEGSTLTEEEFILLKKNVEIKKSKNEIQEAKNSIECFNLITSMKILNEKNMLKIYQTLTKNLTIPIKFNEPIEYPKKYKLFSNVVGGEKTTDPKDVKKEIKNLFKWYKENENKTHPLKLAFDFYYKFEKIHPFQDGNGRVGRFLMNFILIKNEYLPIIIFDKNKINQSIAFQNSKKNMNYFYKFLLDQTKETYFNSFPNYLKK